MVGDMLAEGCSASLPPVQAAAGRYVRFSAAARAQQQSLSRSCSCHCDWVQLNLQASAVMQFAALLTWLGQVWHPIWVFHQEVKKRQPVLTWLHL
jgi:hypothetical protein